MKLASLFDGLALLVGHALNVALRLHTRVDARQKGPLEMEFRRRVKGAFDGEGIGIPYPQRVIHVASDQKLLAPPSGKESVA